MINIRELQILLGKAHYRPGVVDGIDGPKTQAALAAFQSDYPEEDMPPSQLSMTVSKRGREAIIKHEGIRLEAYPDPGTGGDPWTIGVGHTSRAGPPNVKPGMTITRAEADQILADDLKKFEKRVRAALGDVPQHVFDGAVSFDFNTGRIHNASWVRHFKSGDMAKAEASLKQWNKAGGRVMRGLTNRRADEATLIFRGVYSA